MVESRSPVLLGTNLIVIIAGCLPRWLLLGVWLRVIRQWTRIREIGCMCRCWCVDLLVLIAGHLTWCRGTDGKALATHHHHHHITSSYLLLPSSSSSSSSSSRPSPPPPLHQQHQHQHQHSDIPTSPEDTSLAPTSLSHPACRVVCAHSRNGGTSPPPRKAHISRIASRTDCDRRVKAAVTPTSARRRARPTRHPRSSRPSSPSCSTPSSTSSCS